MTSNICYDTISLIFVMILLTALQESTNHWVSSMAYNMREIFDKYWESTRKINKMLIVASILDPRAKMDFGEHILRSFFAMIV